MKWLKGVLVAIDQLGNAIAGGNPDATISARTGYFSRVIDTPFKPYWQMMEKVIDFTFFPIDGPNHCFKAYLADQFEEHQEGSDLMRGLLGVIILACCIPLSVLTRLYVLVVPRAAP
ncbi:hypothetical protein ACNKU7_18215 [Microbulbifer sp. SA54]|uniref:hypothetical protein n=1 Tax=Microbulbifer sp. SA54 TaxID=3401577 RepID=UPI003AAE9758